MAKEKWYYEKLDDKGRIRRAPLNDPDGKITGHNVFMLKEWFDENPEERKRLGWIKHIQHRTKDIEYDKATQYLVNAVKRVDEYTVEDDYKIIDKSEEEMRLTELGMCNSFDVYGDGYLVWGGEYEDEDDES